MAKQVLKSLIIFIPKENLVGNLAKPFYDTTTSTCIPLHPVVITEYCMVFSWSAYTKRKLGGPNKGLVSLSYPTYPKTYVDLLSEDTGLCGMDLETTMLERCHWRDTIFRDPRTTH